MKRIAYIGSLTPAQRSINLLNLYNASRIYNSENKINGVFLISKDAILQIIEGESGQVGQAVYRSRREGLLDDIRVLVSQDVNSPLFNNWPLRFLKLGNPSHHEFVNKLKITLEPHFNFDRSEDKALIETMLTPPNTVVAFPIHSRQETAGDDNDLNHYSNCSLSINAWPRPTQVGMSPPAINTCSLLARGGIHYKDLVIRKIWNSEKDLLSFLTALNDIGVLQAVNMEHKATVDTYQKSNDRFSHLIKNFINSPHRKAT